MKVVNCYEQHYVGEDKIGPGALYVHSSQSQIDARNAELEASGWKLFHSNVTPEGATYTHVLRNKAVIFNVDGKFN